MTAALMVPRCRCGTPIPAGYDGCGDRRCFEARYLLNPYVVRLQEPAYSPRTSDAWIADHCHEWETPLGGNE